MDLATQGTATEVARTPSGAHRTLPDTNASSGATAAINCRSNRLMRALVRIGLRPGHRVAVVCCDDHVDDARTAHLAAIKAGATPLTVRTNGDTEDAAVRLRDDPVRFVLACAEGAAQWERYGLRGVLVADAANAYWWPMLENRECDEPVVGRMVTSVEIAGAFPGFELEPPALGSATDAPRTGQPTPAPGSRPA